MRRGDHGEERDEQGTSVPSGYPPFAVRGAALRLVPSLVVLLAGCHHAADTDLPECDGSATVDPAVHTFLDVAWQGDGDVAHVEFQADGGPLLSTPEVDEPGPDHAAKLMGLPALTDVAYTAFSGEEACRGTARTENADAGLPSFSVDVPTADDADVAPFVLMTVVGTRAALEVVDRQGRLVWWDEPDAQYEVVQARFSRDGRDVLFDVADPTRQTDVGAIVRHSLEREEVSVVDTPLGHHAFVELPDGTLAYLAADMRPWTDPDSGEDLRVVGDDIVEIAPDGTSRTVWTTWDAFPVERNPGWSDGFYGNTLADWSHANALEYDEATDTYLTSLANMDTVAQISRSTGETVRSLGRYGEYQPADAGTPMLTDPHAVNFSAWPHLMLFVTQQTASGAVEIALDDETKTYSLVWSSGLDGDLVSPFLGEARRLPNGDTLVGYGSVGVLREVAPSGEIVWQASSELGAEIGSATMFESFYSF